MMNLGKLKKTQLALQKLKDQRTSGKTKTVKDLLIPRRHHKQRNNKIQFCNISLTWRHIFLISAKQSHVEASFYVKRCKTSLCTTVPSVKSFEQETMTLWRESQRPPGKYGTKNPIFVGLTRAPKSIEVKQPASY